MASRNQSGPAWVSTLTLTLVLGTALVALIAWKLIIRFSLIPAGHPLAASLRSKDLTSHATVVVVCLALAGGVATLAYFAAGRSQRAASVGSAAIMLLAIGVFATQLVLYYTGYTRPNTAQSPPGAASPPSPSQLMAEQAKQMREQTQESEKRMQQQQDRAREEAERLRRPITPAGPPPSQPRPGASPSPTGTAQTPPAAPSLPSTPTAEELEVERKTKAALDPLRAEIKAKIAEFLVAAAPLADALGKPPKARHTELDARIKSTDEAKQKAKDLEAYLRAADKRVEAALKSAGLDMGDQIRGKIAFSQSENLFSKANACGDYLRLFEAGLDEAKALKETAGKWKTDADGQATSTEAALKNRLRHLREGVSMRLRAAGEAENTLKAPAAP